MRLYPAIDIKDGKCVRLKKGLFNEVTVYSDKPYEIAESFEADGAKFIHTVIRLEFNLSTEITVVPAFSNAYV